MTHLLIDNSNTVTKFVLGDERTLIGEVARIDTAELTVEKIRALTSSLRYESVCIASVVPRAQQVLAAHFSAIPLHRVSHQSDLPLDIASEAPEQIGADRLANAVAAVAAVAACSRNDAPVIAIDFGTAVTFDVVGNVPPSEHSSLIEKKATYLGGVIAPGLASMTHYLSEQTALLPSLELNELFASPHGVKAIGKTTAQAMQAGTLIGYRGLVREIITSLQKELAAHNPAPPKIIATGGHATLLAAHLPEIAEVDPLLTLEGIRLIARKNLP